VQKLGVVLILTAFFGYAANVRNVPIIFAAEPSFAQLPAADKRPVIVCFGDSLTAGYGVDHDLSYPADLQRSLDAKGYKYRVVNMGVSGETTKDGLARVDRVLALKPELVVVELGGNDGLRGLPIADTEKNLDAIVSGLKKGGLHVVMAGITLPSDYGPDYVGRFNGMFPMIAKKNGVKLLPFIYKDVYGVPGYIQDDRTHATAKGNVQVAKNIEGLILPLLKK
jgi:acyl-CoA thioesterase-1